MTEDVRRLAERIGRIVEDTSLKMDDPDVYERTYLAEDFLARIVDAIAPYLTEPPAEWLNHRIAYPETLSREPSGIVRPFAHTGEQISPEIVSASEKAIREARAAMTWDGVTRHAYVPSYSGMVCGSMVMRHGHGDECGLHAEHAIHTFKMEEM